MNHLVVTVHCCCATVLQEYSMWLCEELGMEKNSRELHVVTPLHLRKFEVLSRQERYCSSQFLPLAMMLKVCQSLILGKFFKVRKFYVQCILSSCKREIVSTIFLLKLS